MNFSAVTTTPWEPSNKPQHEKWNRIKKNSSNIPMVIVEPDDVDIPLPYRGKKYVKGEGRGGREEKARRAEVLKAVKDLERERACDRKLDGFCLLDGGGRSGGLPEDIRRSDVSDLGLGNVTVEDLPYFSRLIYVDGGNNHLPVEPFAHLPRLQELRLHCNAIRHLPDMEAVVREGGFGMLTTLDLSYNAIGVDGVEQLSFIPNLQNLDLTYNTLEILPTPSVMANFFNLRTVKLGNNSFESDMVLISLSQCPRLREVDLSYNYLQRIPKEVIEDNCFVGLETLNLAYNYVAEEEELLPAVLIEKLTRLIVYGNPLCGFRGEDPSEQCVRRVIEASIEARDGWGDHDLTVITVKPGKEVKPGKDGKGVRGNLYKDLHLSQVIEENIPTASQFRMAGNKQLDVLNVAGDQIEHNYSKQFEEKDDYMGGNTFMTNIDIEDQHDEKFEVEDGFFDKTGGLVVPSSLLQTSFNRNNNNTDNSKLHAAINALRHALKGADDRGDTLKINDPRTGINRPNAAYLSRALPKRRNLDADADDKEHKELRATTPGIKNAKKNAKQKGKAALHQLEDMLDNMNDRMEDIERANGDGRARTAGIASRSGDRAIGELVTMVNTVVDKLS